MILNLPKLIGHRGVKDIAPENTLQAINKAIQFKLKWIEIDVKISKDHIPFLLHDDLLDRTTSGKGLPYKLAYGDIKNLDAGSWFNPKFNQLYPPTLQEVLELCSRKNIGVNIELKPNAGREKQNINAINNLFKKNKFNCQYYFSSFDFFSLKLMRKIMPKAFLGFLINEMKDKKDFVKIIEDCIKLKCFSLGFNIKLINKKIIQICQENKFKILVFSDKNIFITEALKLWNLGVDSVFVDNPVNYKKIINNL